MEQGMVSVITPCYNGAGYISETIESVIAQTYENWEMIIIDDGSLDNSAEIIRSYEERDPRIRLISQKNAGSASARNRGIRNAGGQYIALLDADDLWDAEFLEEQIAFMKRKDAVCVCCSYRRINDKSEEILRPIKTKSTITYKDMTVMNRIGCLSGLYDISRYGKVYLREELKSIRDDYAYWLDIVKLEGYVAGNSQVLASYRILSDSTTGNKKKLVKKQFAFYHDYLKFGVIHSGINVLRWGIAGMIKFSG